MNTAVVTVDEADLASPQASESDVAVSRALLLRTARTGGEAAVDALLACWRRGWLDDVDQLLSEPTIEFQVAGRKRRSAADSIKGWWSDVYCQRSSGRDAATAWQRQLIDAVRRRDGSAAIKLVQQSLKKALRTEKLPHEVALYALLFVARARLAGRAELMLLADLATDAVSCAEVAQLLTDSWEEIRTDPELMTLFSYLAATAGRTDFQRLAASHHGLDLRLEREAERPAAGPPASGGRRSVSAGDARIAVCISGLMRNSALSARYLKTTVIDPLAADTFVHVWDEEETWPGFGTGRSMSGIVNPQAFKALPKAMRTIAAFRENFPRTAARLAASQTGYFEADDLLAVLQPTKMVVEARHAFTTALSYDSSQLVRQGALNQAWMHYKINAAHRLMEEHERREGFSYDFVVRIRPDFFLNRPLTRREVTSLTGDELGVARVMRSGADDQFAVGARSAMDRYADFWTWIDVAQSMSPFPAYPDAVNHRLFLFWLLRSRLTFRSLNIAGSLSTAKLAGMPAIKSQLIEDIRSLKTRGTGGLWTRTFMRALLKR